MSEGVDLAEALEAAARGDYSAVPGGDDRASRAARQLIERLAKADVAKLADCVEVSMRCGEAAVESAWLLKSNNDLSQAVRETVVATEDFSSSIARIDASATNVVSQLDLARRAASDGQGSAQTAEAQMISLAKSVSMSVERLGALGEASTRIQEFVDSIDKISQQISLLAVNAGIEAARAGRAGASFGIVAEEVRRLASATADLTRDIRHRMEAMRAETTAVSQSIAASEKAVASGGETLHALAGEMAEIGAAVAQAASAMQDTKASLGTQSVAAAQNAEAIASIERASAESLAAVRQMSRSVDAAIAAITAQLTLHGRVEAGPTTLLLAKWDHIAWKKKLADMFSGKASLNVSELSSHHNCRLGKWYDSSAADQYRGSPAFVALDAPHEAVHRAGIEAARAFQRGAFGEALAHYEAVEQASVAVIRALDRLIALEFGDPRAARAA